jgi:hypothetical protein
MTGTRPALPTPPTGNTSEQQRTELRQVTRPGTGILSTPSRHHLQVSFHFFISRHRNLNISKPYITRIIIQKTYFDFQITQTFYILKIYRLRLKITHRIIALPHRQSDAISSSQGALEEWMAAYSGRHPFRGYVSASLRTISAVRAIGKRSQHLRRYASGPAAVTEAAGYRPGPPARDEAGPLPPSWRAPVSQMVAEPPGRTGATPSHRGLARHDAFCIRRAREASRGLAGL